VVHLNLLDSQTGNTKLLFETSNVQDQEIPIAKVLTNEFGIGAALDIKGNLRVYDLHRYRKIGKVQPIPKSASTGRDPMTSTISIQSANSLIGEANFRIYPRVCFETMGEQMVIVTSSRLIDEPSDEQWGAAEED